MLVACGAGGGGEQAQISGPVDTRAPVAAGPTSSIAPPAGGPATTATVTTPPAGTAGTAPPSSAGAPAPTRAPAPAPLGPAPAGTYQYDTAGQTTLGGGAPTPYPAVTTAVIDPPVGNRQHGLRDLRDAGGNGTVFESTFEYRPDGVYLVSLTATVKVLVFSDTEQLGAGSPVLLLPTGAAPGYHRDFDVPVASGGVAHLALDVVRTERVTGVDTRLFHIVATLPGAYNAHLDFNIWLGPNSLWRREHVVADATAAGITFRSEYDATLRG